MYMFQNHTLKTEKYNFVRKTIVKFQIKLPGLSLLIIGNVSNMYLGQAYIYWAGLKSSLIWRTW